MTAMSIGNMPKTEVMGCVGKDLGRGPKCTKPQVWTLGEGLHLDTDISGIAIPGGLKELRAPTTQHSSLVVPGVMLRALLDFYSIGYLPPLQPPGFRPMPTSSPADVLVNQTSHPLLDLLTPISYAPLLCV